MTTNMLGLRQVLAALHQQPHTHTHHTRVGCRLPLGKQRLSFTGADRSAGVRQIILKLLRPYVPITQ